jgi:hypothetical protein
MQVAADVGLSEKRIKDISSPTDTSTCLFPLFTLLSCECNKINKGHNYTMHSIKSETALQQPPHSVYFSAVALRQPLHSVYFPAAGLRRPFTLRVEPSCNLQQPSTLCVEPSRSATAALYMLCSVLLQVAAERYTGWVAFP